MRLGPFQIPAAHPALAGHFPGHPITPGVVTLDRVLSAARQAGFPVCGLAHAKFPAPLPPDTPFFIEISPNDAQIDFRVVGEQGQLFCQGALYRAGQTTP